MHQRAIKAIPPVILSLPDWSIRHPQRGRYIQPRQGRPRRRSRDAVTVEPPSRASASAYSRIEW